jgi:valacyclovir hydrolase
MPIAALSEVTLFYEDRGAGEILLLVPGALGTAQVDFDCQLSFFCKTHRVIAPDPRGYGRSQPPERDYPVDFYERDADDFIRLIDDLGAPRFSILGWSDGANVAAIIAAKIPQRVNKLVMWAGNSFLTEEEIKSFEAIRSLSAWSPRLLEALRPVYGEKLGTIWDQYVSALIRLYKAGGELYRSRLAAISARALILHGDKDPLVPKLHPEILSQEIRGAKLYRFPEGKHNIHVKYAAEFNRIVADFLTEAEE